MLNKPKFVAIKKGDKKIKVQVQSTDLKKGTITSVAGRIYPITVVIPKLLDAPEVLSGMKASKAVAKPKPKVKKGAVNARLVVLNSNNFCVQVLTSTGAWTNKWYFSSLDHAVRSLIECHFLLRGEDGTAIDLNYMLKLYKEAEQMLSKGVREAGLVAIETKTKKKGKEAG